MDAVRDSASEHVTRVAGPVRDTVRPGDFLPPQAVLHGTRWQHSGYHVGRRERDVRLDMPTHSGQVLLFARDGTSLALSETAQVSVQRPDEQPARLDDQGEHEEHRHVDLRRRAEDRPPALRP